jgi:aquaporin Z
MDDQQPTAGFSASMLLALKSHWPEYLSEAAGLMFFMVNAAWVTTLLEYPGSPVHRAIGSDFARRVLLGIVMGLVIAIIIYNPLGKRSGAHINPAVTWAFLRLGKIGRRDAAFYTLFQFLGGIAAAFLMSLLLGAPFRDPKVMFAATLPGKTTGPWIAFIAEFAITFILMFILLMGMNSKKWEKRVGWIAAALIMVYLWFETPLSGMSLNPARSFGSALAGNIWTGIWVYFTAPPLAALLAAEIFLRMKGPNGIACARFAHGGDAEKFLCGDQPLPAFPIEKEGAEALSGVVGDPKPAAVASP